MPKQIMPKLNEIKGIAEKKKKSSAKPVKTVLLRSGLAGTVDKYNAAADKVREARAVMETLAPALHAEGLAAVFLHNCACREDTKQQIKSVNLTEVAMPGVEEPPQAVQFTWTTRGLKIDEAVVTAHFKNLRMVDGGLTNVNNYAEWVIKADFDKSVFTNGNGKFDQKRFEKYLAALQKVSDELGVENPLTLSKEFVQVKEMNERRFRELTPVQNMELHTVLPTATSLEPVRSKEEDED